ncbi:unnamed protein product [Psylliodes chrysocephalus]|uniref:DNA repair protein SWI5 homolog n=1 Tax=Psylliodes chrysocephalus TaxID=3402493 RepID=A0A9P0CSS4_9CUCU|nr:unnamed protein product [Psylliodes chrysocephala]
MDHTKPRSKLYRTPKKLKKVDSKETSTNLELKSRYERLQKENSKLDKEIEGLEKDGVTEDMHLQMEALHDYNEMKDVTQVVLGYLADVEHVTLKELHQRYNLPIE